MIRRFLLASALLITGTIVAAPSAFAEDGNVGFSGDVSSTCVFGSPSPGAITAATANATSLTTVTPATTTVACNFATTLTVAAPSQTDGSTLSGTATSTVTASGSGAGTIKTTTSVGTPPPIDILSGLAATLTVGMTASNGTDIVPADSYAYTVTLTAVTP